MTLVIIFITATISVYCFGNRTRIDRLSLQPYRIIHHKEWYRILTHAFVHGDYMHLIINMIVLLSFGQYTERLFQSYARIGTIGHAHLAYALLYFGGIVAASIYDLVSRRNDPYFSSIGASGAVSAVIFTTIFFSPWNKLYLFGVLPVPGIIFGLLYLVYSQFMGGRRQDRVNHYAHLFGALYGFGFPLLMHPGFINVFWENLTNFR